MKKEKGENYEIVAGVFILTWIICWFLAIWIFHIQFFLTGLFCFVLGWIFYGTGKMEKEKIE